MYSILLITDQVADALREQLGHTGLRWKNGDSTTDYVETVPNVCAFTYDDLQGTQPLHTPAVLVQIMGLQGGVASFLAHVCVCYPAIQDKEITHTVEGTQGLYEYGTGDGIDSAGARVELYKACLMLAERVFVALGKISNSNIPIRNIALQTPSPYMADFPYCDCTISFDVETPQTESIISTTVSRYL